MRFLVDMPLSPGLAAWLRENGHDAVHAAEAGLDQAPDGEIIERGRQEHRTIITADLDFPRLLAIAQNVDPSLILFRSGNWSDAEVIARLRDVLSSLSEAEITQSILIVERQRVRRRRLPIEK